MASSFSAVGYYFARDLHATRKVPVGIIHGSWGGTPAEAWTSEAGLRTLPDFAGPLAELKRLAADPGLVRQRAEAKQTEWFEKVDPASKPGAAWSAADLDTADWRPMTLPAYIEGAGSDQPRPGVPQGKVELFSYDSTVTAKRREAIVYLPPGYSAETRYPVLYLLHGIGGNHYEWPGYIKAPAILDNLIADGKAVPMIVVMPNGRALPDDRPPKEIYSPEHAAGFAKFERDLLDCLIPAVQAKYSALTSREHRALAGLSMGGGQSLNFGLGNLDRFARVAGFSSAPNTKPPAELVSDPAAARGKLKLLYLSCGNKDGLIHISQGVQRHLKQHDVPHVRNVDNHGHDGATWGSNLYPLTQKLFR